MQVITIKLYCTVDFTNKSQGQNYEQQYVYDSKSRFYSAYGSQGQLVKPLFDWLIH